jgi:hypothetical protein
MPALLTRLTLALVTLLTGGLLVARWAGEQGSPADSRVGVLALCGGRPCILGLVPGETRWDTTEAALQVGSARTIYRKTEPAGEFGFFPSVDSVSLGRVSITLDEPMQAGWIIQRFGPPCGVSLYWEMQIVTLRYPALLANVQMIGDGLHLDDPVTSIHFSDPHFIMERQPDLCMDNVSPHAVFNTVWRGFAPFRRYLEFRLDLSRL